MDKQFIYFSVVNLLFKKDDLRILFDCIHPYTSPARDEGLKKLRFSSPSTENPRCDAALFTTAQ